MLLSTAVLLRFPNRCRVRVAAPVGARSRHCCLRPSSARIARCGERRQQGAGRTCCEPRGAIERRPDCRGDHSDLVQEAFLNATRGFGHFQGASYPEFMGWLHRILLNKAAELARKRQSRGPTGKNRKAGGASGISGLPDRGRSPSSVARHNEYRTLVQEALSKLPAAYQQVLRLRLRQWIKLSRYRRAIVPFRGRSPHEIQSCHGMLWPNHSSGCLAYRLTGRLTGRGGADAFLRRRRDGALQRSIERLPLRC